VSWKIQQVSGAVCMASGEPGGDTKHGAPPETPIWGGHDGLVSFVGPAECFQRDKAVAASRSLRWRLTGRCRKPSPEMTPQPEPGGDDNYQGEKVLDA